MSRIGTADARVYIGGGRRCLSRGAAYRNEAIARVKVAYPCDCDSPQLPDGGACLRHSWTGAKWARLVRRLARYMAYLDKFERHTLSPAPSADEFFVVSLKWSRRSDGLIALWAPADAGYCFQLEQAGRYTTKQVTENASYYNGDVTLAIPCAELVKVAMPVHKYHGNALDRYRSESEHVVSYRHLTALRRAWCKT